MVAGPAMDASILSIGTEITRGELVNTNAAWLSEELTNLGYRVVEHATVDDDETRIVRTLKDVSSRAALVVATGGLGPTSDDLTSACVARALAVDLVRDQGALEAIKRRFLAVNRTMSPSNEKQADFPQGATILANPEGTAPGFAVTCGSARCFFLPGVPSEMRRMFLDGVRPAIAFATSSGEPMQAQVHLRTFGLPESVVGERLAGIEAREPGLVIGYRAHFPEIEVKVNVTDSSGARAEERARAIADEVRMRLGDHVYGGRDDTFPGWVGQILRDLSKTLAVAESCTGGLIGSMVTSVPGSSDYLLLDAVTYSNASKTQLLGVLPETLRAHGAVSSEVSMQMAEGALRASDADIAVAVTGIAGPGGATEEKPVGTIWFAIARPEMETISFTRRLWGDRNRIRTLASYVALRSVARIVQGLALD